MGMAASQRLVAGHIERVEVGIRARQLKRPSKHRFPIELQTFGPCVCDIAVDEQLASELGPERRIDVFEGEHRRQLRRRSNEPEGIGLAPAS